jgi:hypothetical protein
MVTTRGGDRLKAALDSLRAKLSSASVVQVGFPANSELSDGTSAPMVAAIQNYGAPRAGIPPRPFFSNMVATKSPQWGKLLAIQLKETDNYPAHALANMGQLMKDQLQQAIIDTTSPPLSPITIMLRKMFPAMSDDRPTGKSIGEAARRVAAGESVAGISAKPLIFSGELLDSVAFLVK